MAKREPYQWICECCRGPRSYGSARHCRACHLAIVENFHGAPIDTAFKIGQRRAEEEAAERWAIRLDQELRPATGMAARRGETAQQARREAQQPGPQGVAQPSPPQDPHD